MRCFGRFTVTVVALFVAFQTMVHAENTSITNTADDAPVVSEAALAAEPSAVVATDSGIVSGHARLLRGSFYYHYLNDDYLPALHALNQWRLQTPFVQSESRVMEAAIYLALGLQREAELAYLDVEQQGGVASGDAWFHLARRWMELSEWSKADDSITRALEQRLTLNDDYYQQALFIQSASRSNQDNLNAAKQPLALMENTGIWSGLARYNWMLAAMRLNANSRDLEKLVEEATFYLSEDNYETKALRDRILLVAGIYALDTGKNRRAEAYFKEISQDTAFTAPGLLHYGWALVEQWKYQQAMQPWRILQQKYNDFHPAVIESILGVPHALELLNATTQSLKTYEVVEGRLQRMLDQLETLNRASEIDAWLDQWLDQQAGQPWGWMRAELADMPDSDLTRLLQSMLDDNKFTTLTQQLYDMVRLNSELERQQQNLSLWQRTLKQRQQYLQRLQGDQKLVELQQRHQQLLRQVLSVQQRLAAEDDKVFAYASVQDQANIERLSAVVPRVERLQRAADPTRDLSQYKERWRRMRGLQLWKIYEEKPQRRWSTTQSFWQLRKDSEGLLEQLNNSQTALRWADSSWQGFPQRVAAGEQSVVRIQQQLDDLYRTQRAMMQQTVSEFLDQLSLRLTDYLAQTRLSIARLYDDALQNQVASGDYSAEPASTSAPTSTSTSTSISTTRNAATAGGSDE